MPRPNCKIPPLLEVLGLGIGVRGYLGFRMRVLSGELLSPAVKRVRDWGSRVMAEGQKIWWYSLDEKVAELLSPRATNEKQSQKWHETGLMQGNPGLHPPNNELPIPVTNKIPSIVQCMMFSMLGVGDCSARRG